MVYTDSEINEFLLVAQEIGIGRAMRQLGYPKSWSSAQYWAKQRGVEVAVDELKARSKAFHDWYETEEVLIVAQEGMTRVYEELLHNDVLTPDDHKKLSEAFQKHYNVWANAQGKATAINETRTTDTMDEHLLELLNIENAKNVLKEDTDINQVDSVTNQDDRSV